MRTLTHRQLLKIGMGLAIAVGAYARLRGLGAWPLSLDGYFTTQSVDNILQHGLPAFDCGGYYMRELTLQYLIAPLLALGVPAEFAARLPPVAFSFAMLPAVYFLGQRLSGVTVACVSVALLSLSLWEIEFARFARMYVPFQAIFIWYLLALHRVVIDRDSAAYGWLWLLSVAGVFTWAGGLFLLVVNFVPGLIPRTPGRAWHWVVNASLLFFGYLYSSLNFRSMGPPPLPPDVPIAAGGSQFVSPPVLAFTLPPHPAWLAGALALLLASLLAAATLVSDRQANVRERVAWTALIFLSLVNLFGSALIGLVLMVLLGWLDLHRASPRSVFVATLAITANFAFWLAYALFTGASHQLFPGFGPGGELSKLAVVLFKYPNVFDSILFPWLATVPALTAALGGLLALAGAWAIWTRNDDARASSLRLTLAVGLIMAALVGVVETKYFKTRYTFFLLPLLYLVGVTVTYTLIGRLTRSRPKRSLALGLALVALVAGTEDFGWAHMVHINRMDWNYRLPLNAALTEHYYGRRDYRRLAQRVNRQAKPDDVIIITALPVAYYLDRTDYVYRNFRDGEFASVSCDKGQRERWSNARLLYRKQNLFQTIAKSSGSVWMIVNMRWRPVPERLLQQPYSAKLLYRGRAGDIGVYKIENAR